MWLAWLRANPTASSEATAPHACTWAGCAKRFVGAGALKLHMNVHNEVHKCPHCGKCVTQARVLADHVRRRHAGQQAAMQSL